MSGAAIEWVDLHGGRFKMGNPRGDGYPQDGEMPVHEVSLTPFAIAATTVTNSQFASFVEETDYTTEAEEFGWSFVFAMFLPEDFEPTRAVQRAEWWRQVNGADWRHPEGPQSDIADRGDHPVVQISWNDAAAFCGWAGARLPTEAEWEYAARGGLEGMAFPWGNALEPDGKHLMNVFQGEFPTGNTCADGFAGTSPVKAFPANGYGLYEMTGNVWEMCSDSYSASSYELSDEVDPRGPDLPDDAPRVQRGGSYLCHASYCKRYRVDARSHNTPESCAGNLGLRVVRND
jgi:formylglycine-generating enzyme required for sulfatase activity